MGKLTRLAEDLIDGIREPEEVSPLAARLELERGRSSVLPRGRARDPRA